MRLENTPFRFPSQRVASLDRRKIRPTIQRAGRSDREPNAGLAPIPSHQAMAAGDPMRSHALAARFDRELRSCRLGDLGGYFDLRIVARIGDRSSPR